MTLRQFLGYALLATPFAVITGLSLAFNGLLETLLCWAIVAVFCGTIIGGCHLLAGPRR